MQAENSDVLLLASVAVAVITRPAVIGVLTTTEKVPFPLAFVVTVGYGLVILVRALLSWQRFSVRRRYVPPDVAFVRMLSRRWRRRS